VKSLVSLRQEIKTENSKRQTVMERFRSCFIFKILIEDSYLPYEAIFRNCPDDKIATGAGFKEIYVHGIHFSG
jgi:hypothetical protein